MAISTCTRCNGSGYANAARDSGMEDAPLAIRPIGVYRCSTCDGTGKVGFDEAEFKELLDKAVIKTNRRMRICKQVPYCHQCGTAQVQIIDCSPLATWKCRHCHHTWRQEPLVVENYLPDLLIEK